MSQPMGFRVHPERVRDYGKSLAESTAHLTAISEYAKDKSGISTGFTGLFMLIKPVVEGIADLYAAGLEWGSGELKKTSEALENAADLYEACDKAAVDQLESLGEPLGQELDESASTPSYASVQADSTPYSSTPYSSAPADPILYASASTYSDTPAAGVR